MSTAMIELRDLVKSFGSTTAVRGISFQVPRGQIVGFLGPNGAGKTTTMRVLTGFLRPTSGEARVQGVRVDENSLATRSVMGYLPENAPLYDEMMVIEQLGFAAEVRRVPAADRRRRLARIVEECGLGDVLGRDIGHLSKGFRQRVGLAQAMIHDPDVLILDEPTSGLDPNQIAEIRGLVRELGREKTVILSTHILSEVQATCDRAIIISEGRLVADDTVAGLMAGEHGGRMRVVVGARAGGPVDGERARLACAGVAGVRSAAAEPGEEDGTVRVRIETVPGEDARRGLFEAAVANDLALLEMVTETVSLEETFRALTVEAGEAHGSAGGAEDEVGEGSDA